MAHIDTQALTDVIASHGAALVLYARQWCRTPDDAVQDALIELARQDPAPQSAVAWLHVAVRRRAMNIGRADARRDNHQRQAALERDAWFVPQDSLPEPSDYEAYLARLPALEREIVVSRVWGELTFAQIAKIVEQPLSTVHRRYRAALTELGRMMNQPGTSGESDEPRRAVT